MILTTNFLKRIEEVAEKMLQENLQESTVKIEGTNIALKLLRKYSLNEENKRSVIKILTVHNETFYLGSPHEAVTSFRSVK